MKIVKEHNEMTEGLEAKKRALLAQLEMVFVFLFTPFYMKKIIIHQAPVFQKLDSTIHRINHCPVDKYYKNWLTYVLNILYNI